MGFLNGGMVGAMTRDPTDDFWYQPVGMQSKSGIRVDADSALKTSAVYRCVTLISQAVGALPLQLFSRSSDGSKRLRADKPLYRVLHDQANDWQTAMEFREMMQAHLCLRGNAFALKEFDGLGNVRALIPLHPDSVEVFVEGRKIRYRVTDGETGTQADYTPSEVFHLRNISSDGIIGLSPIACARESIGMALAAEDYGARFFANDARPRGVIKMPGQFKDKTQRDAFINDWRKVYGGSNRHRTAVLEHGMDYVSIGMDNRDAQFLETRTHQVEDIARYFGVPPHMIGATEKTTSWGSGIEQQGIGFVVYTLSLQWLTRWEQAIKRDLIRERSVFAEHNVDGLLRGDSKTRQEGYAIAVQNGWMTVNEVRRKENMDPIPGGDTLTRALNMAPVESEPEEQDDQADALAMAEVDHMRETLDPDRPAHSVRVARDFYHGFEVRLVGAGLSKDDAKAYCRQSYEQIKALAASEWVDMLDSWSHTKPQALREVMS